MGVPHKLKNYTDDKSAQSFFDGADRLAKYIDSVVEPGDRLLVIHHNSDADGNTSGIIAEEIGYMLQLDVEKLGVPQISNEEIEEIRREIEEYDPDLIIFTDIGSGYKKLLENAEFDKLGKDIVILDHHPPIGPKRKFKELNPHNYGMDGAHSCSGATISYAMAESIYDRLDDGRKEAYKEFLRSKGVDFDPDEPVLSRLSPTAMIGAIVDGTDPDGRVNRAIFKKAEVFGKVQEIEWPFYGFHRRTLVHSLSQAGSPYIPGITNDDKATRQFLSRLGLKTSLKPYELDDSQRKLIIDSLKELIDKSDESDIFKEYQKSLLDEKTYLLVDYVGKEYGTVSEFGSLVTACTKYGKTPEEIIENRELARRVLLGEEDAFDEAIAVWKEYRREISRGIGKFNYLIENDYYKINRYEIDGSDKAVGITVYMRNTNPAIVGTLASMGSGSKILSEKSWEYARLPVLVYTYVRGKTAEESYFKFSARAPDYLEAAGLDLGDVMSAAAEAAGGIGGGHNCAAGASIPRDGYNAFFSVYAEYLGKQLEDYIKNGYRLTAEQELRLIRKSCTEILDIDGYSIGDYSINISENPAESAA